MVFWTCILVGGFFVWLAVKIGFYETIIHLFNIIISIYVAIFLTPVILVSFPDIGDVQFSQAIVLSAVAVGIFLVLYGITYFLLTAQFKVSFPKVFEIFFAGILGFFTGFLVASFAALIITLTPLSQNTVVNKAGFNRTSLQDNLIYVRKLCDSVQWFVSLPGKDVTSGKIIDELFDNIKPKEQQINKEQIQTNQSIEPNYPKS
jgi:uncharacterized membrane protein required for colicin V production